MASTFPQLVQNCRTQGWEMKSAVWFKSRAYRKMRGIVSRLLVSMLMRNRVRKLGKLEIQLWVCSLCRSTNYMRIWLNRPIGSENLISLEQPRRRILSFLWMRVRYMISIWIRIIILFFTELGRRHWRKLVISRSRVLLKVYLFVLDVCKNRRNRKNCKQGIKISVYKQIYVYWL